MAEFGIYRIVIDEEWNLEDLHDFPHRYSQTYNFIYWFGRTDPSSPTEGLDARLNSFPWQGGFSYVHAYETLKQITPPLRIAAMSKQSPGWIDVIANVDTALHVARAVGIYSVAGISAITAYRRAHAHWLSLDLKAERDRWKIGELKRKQVRANMDLLDDLAKQVGFENTSQLVHRVQDPDLALGLLLAHYRRVENLAEYVKEGKAKLPRDAPKRAE
jgi:hypothetical protein